MNGYRGASRFVSMGVALLFVGSLLLSQACGGGGGGGGGRVPPVMRFVCSGGVAPSPDQVSLSCPATSGSPLLVSVIIGGATTSTDIYGIKFDLVFSPTVMTFDGPAIEGTFLNQGGVATTLIASSSPGDPGRVVVSITRTGAVSGTQATTTQTTVMTLSFAATGVAGSTSLTFENTEVVDSMTPTPIASVNFTSSPLTVSFQ